jgi:hypothetical protein
VVAIACIAAGCGGGASEEELARDRAAQAELLSGEVYRRQVAAAEAEAAARYSACENQVGPLINSLEELDSRLGVGLNFSDYSERVGDARVAYDDIDVDELTSACIEPGRAGEAALNAYIKAYNLWNNCFADLDCGVNSIEPRLQQHWVTASIKTEAAAEALEGMTQYQVPPQPSKSMPRSYAEVGRTVYGGARDTICLERDPPAVTEPCLRLDRLLKGGIEENEIDELDETVQDLNASLGLSGKDGEQD